MLTLGSMDMGMGVLQTRSGVCLMARGATLPCASAASPFLVRVMPSPGASVTCAYSHLLGFLPPSQPFQCHKDLTQFWAFLSSSFHAAMCGCVEHLLHARGHPSTRAI